MIEQLFEDLNLYLKTRDRGFYSRKWELVTRAVETFNKVNYEGFAFLYNAAFSLAWQLQDDFKQDQSRIRDRIIKPAQALLSPDPLPGGPNTAWIVNNAQRGMYAPWKHVEGFLAGQRPCYVYIFSYASPESIKDIEAMGHTVRVFAGDTGEKVASIRAACELDKIGTLIAETYTAVPLTLFAMRSAPVQMYLSPGFQLFPADVTLIPETQDVMVKSFEIVPSPMRHDALFRVAEPKAREYPLIFGCLSRYEKMSVDYLGTVGQILDTTGGVFMAYGRGDLPDVHPKIIKCGIEKPEVALGSMDVYLDTFPTCGGVSVWEAMAAQVPVITLASETMQSWNNLKPYVTASKKLYIEAAIEASSETPLRRLIIEQGLNQARQFADVQKAGAALDRIIEKWQSRTIPNSKPPSPTG
jgi:hypothetical protein